MFKYLLVQSLNVLATFGAGSEFIFHLRFSGSPSFQLSSWLTTTILMSFRNFEHLLLEFSLSWNTHPSAAEQGRSSDQVSDRYNQTGEAPSLEKEIHLRIGWLLAATATGWNGPPLTELHDHLAASL